jgi:hypothetical protein
MALPQVPAARRRGNVTLRMREEVRTALQREADARGRSLSEEIENRLEASLSQRQSAIEALDLVYGQRLNDLLLTMGRVIKKVVEYRPFYRPSSDADWLDSPWKFDELVKAANVLLERLRPPGEIAPPPEIHISIGTAGLGPKATPEQKAALREAHRRAAEIECAELSDIGRLIAAREIDKIAARQSEGGIALRDKRIAERLSERAP